MPERVFSKTPASRMIRGTALFALVFGILTIVAGGAVIFGPDGARDGAGAVVPFVLWFNFAAGFVYVTAAYGI